MTSLPYRKLERNIRLLIVTLSMFLVTWLILANGRLWTERQQTRRLLTLRNHDLSRVPRVPVAMETEHTNKNQEPGAEHPAKRVMPVQNIEDNLLQYSMANLMSWNPGQIKNLTHHFSKEMSQCAVIRVIPAIYQKQLTAEQRQMEGNIYLPGRDVIVAHGLRTYHKTRRKTVDQPEALNTITKEEMTEIKDTLERRLQEHAQRLSTDPISFDRNNLPPALNYLDPKIFQIFPERFLEDYKNPCWWDAPSLQCIPYFYIGGAPKCATSDMWNRLSGHPDVMRTQGKESHWWSRGNHSDTDVRSFISRNKRVFKNQGGHNSEMAKKRVAMDASACTFWHNYRAARILGNPPEGPPVLLADVMRAAQPDAKFIFIFRNPTDRQYSEYLDIDDLWKGRVKSPVDFHARIQNGIRLFHLCLRENTLRHCVAINSAPRLHISMYSVHLREWFQRFPREQIHILRTDEWKRNVTKEITSILQFLDLPTLPQTRLDEIINAGNTGVRSSRNEGIGPMMSETKSLLDDYFSVFRKDLANLLKNYRYLWNEEG